jgi:hypothetical protein
MWPHGSLYSRPFLNFHLLGKPTLTSLLKTVNTAVPHGAHSACSTHFICHVHLTICWQTVLESFASVGILFVDWLFISLLYGNVNFLKPKDFIVLINISQTLKIDLVHNNCSINTSWQTILPLALFLQPSTWETRMYMKIYSSVLTDDSTLCE